MKNPYDVLRVGRKATQEEIEDAYYRMRRLVSYGHIITERALNEAYAVLSDPDRRTALDESLRGDRRVRARGASTHEARRSVYQALQRLIRR